MAGIINPLTGKPISLPFNGTNATTPVHGGAEGSVLPSGEGRKSRDYLLGLIFGGSLVMMVISIGVYELVWDDSGDGRHKQKRVTAVDAKDEPIMKRVKNKRGLFARIFCRGGKVSSSCF
ncbi:hypothetical protein JNK13_08955 [bacterium]|nr:hypothetical protein [bacterium]